MTEAEAWQMIGEAFDKYAATGVQDQLARNGLCYAKDHLPDAWDRENRERGRVMTSKIWDAVFDVGHSSYLGHYDRETASHRAALAYLFAAEAAA